MALLHPGCRAANRLGVKIEKGAMANRLTIHHRKRARKPLPSDDSVRGQERLLTANALIKKSDGIKKTFNECKCRVRATSECSWHIVTGW